MFFFSLINYYDMCLDKSKKFFFLNDVALNSTQDKYIKGKNMKPGQDNSH